MSDEPQSVEHVKQVFIIGAERRTIIIDIGKGEDIFQKTSIFELKKKIREKLDSEFNTPIADEADDLRLIFAGKEVRCRGTDDKEKKMSDYDLVHGSTLQAVFRVHGGEDKLYDPEQHYGIKFTLAPDALTGEENSDGVLRAVMSCGHAADPNSLTAWCRSLIDQGRYKFYCPAVVEKTKNKLCRKEWEYTEVRRVALLNDEEKQFFETKISEFAAHEYCEFKECPGCRSYLERKDQNNLRVNCALCTKKKGKNYDFCWQCEKEWTGGSYMNVAKCGRDDCEHPEYPAVRDSPLVELPDVSLGEKVPLRRACSTCGKVVEHNRKACKFIICPRCCVEFCFSCLKTKRDCLEAKGASWFKSCKDGVAKKQTVMPVWSKQV